MSQATISQRLQKTCDGCGTTKEWEMVGIVEGTIYELQEWITIIREPFIDGQFVRVMAHACSRKCLPAADEKLMASITQPPPEDEPADQIDLAKLSVN